MKITERLLNVAVAHRKDSAQWKQLPPQTWPELVAGLDLEHPADHRECGGYVPALLRNGRKRREDIVSRSVLTLDADKSGPTFPGDVARVMPGVAAAVHTTWRHGVEGWRYRLLAPLSRDVTGEEYQRLACAVRDALGEHWGPDKGCPEPERFMYRPSTQNGSYYSRVLDGEPLDVDVWLREEEPHQDEKPPVPQEEKPLHPYAARVIEAELARLDACDLLGWNGLPWNNTTYEVACNLIEFANSPWSGYTLDAAEADLLDRAPTDEDFGAAEHATCWASAEKKVDGKGRPRPSGNAADDFEKVKRSHLDVSNTAKAAEWLLQEVGRQDTPLAGLFRRAGGLVHTPRIDEDGYVPLVDDGPENEDGPAQVRPVDAARLRSWVQFNYRPVEKWVEARKAWVPATFPNDAATLVVNAVELAPVLRPLAGVTHTPMLRADGSVLSEEGYDEASARLYLPEGGMAVVPVPDEPTAAQVNDAHALIAEMLAGFDFNTEHDRANYLALLFTPLLRVMVPPPYPLGLIHAHQPGSGKGLLAPVFQ